MSVRHQCEARVGFVGNPSDGFKGKTVSFLIGNFEAEVGLNEEAGAEYTFYGASDKVFQSLDSFDSFRTTIGEPEWYAGIEDGGISLCMATFSMLVRCLDGMKITDRVIQSKRGLAIHYKTSIPRCVGLSGSSAIITACWRSLLSFYGLTLSDIGISKEYLPSLILEIERRELNIAAGLQDRVIQTYGGLVHMDFSVDRLDSSPTVDNLNDLAATLTQPGQYTSLDPSLLPPLYLIYNTQAGGDSGGVHSTVRERWQNKDPDLIAAMKKLGDLADEAVVALKSSDYKRLAAIMDSNFAIRRKTYGDDVVGPLNLDVAEKARKMGLSVKFSGSGGAFVGMRSSGEGFYEAEEEEAIIRAMEGLGFAMTRISLPRFSAPSVIHARFCPDEKPWDTLTTQTQMINGLKCVEEALIKGSQTVLTIVHDSVTNCTTGAIVNAANEGCLGGGGIDGQIGKLGGDLLYQARLALPILSGASHGPRCLTGDAKLTISGDLPCEYVIHAVGPRFNLHGPWEDEFKLLEDAYKNALARAHEKNLESVAFCILSAGLYRGGCSLQRIVEIGLKSIIKNVYPGLKRVFFCAFTDAEREAISDII